MAQVDFALLRRRIAAAARQTFDAVRSSHSDETVYVFALYTVDDAVGINPSINSEQAYHRTIARVMANEPQRKWLESQRISLPTFLLGDHRWSPYSWEYECAQSDGFEAVNKLINNQGRGFYDEGDQAGFATFKASVLASMVLALDDLNKQGHFGEGRDRESLTVFCSVPHSKCTIWFEEDSARRLNPPGVYQTFAAERIKWIASGSVNKHSKPDIIQAIYRSLVQNG